MSLTSFYSALTGINNNSLAINVIGDNLANMNTTAFKSSRANFSELLAGMSGTSSTGNPITFGLGSTFNGVTRIDTQGTIINTGITTNAAINGNGYFVVSTDGGLGYTRAGNFGYDKEGNLLSSDGFQLMGYMASNGEIDTNSAIVPIELQKGQLIAANPTTFMSITANLDAMAENGTAFSTPMQVFDSLGASHHLTVTFTKVANGEWAWNASIPGDDVTGATVPAPSVGTGTLQFNEFGVLTAPTANPLITVSNLANGAAVMQIEFRLSENGSRAITNTASESTTSNTLQNGYAASPLVGINIDDSGIIVGLTQNGQSVPLAQLALADFPNTQGLQKFKGSTFIAFTSSGEPSIGTAGTGGRGDIRGSSVEQSNVDMAQEFINLIVAQRAYQANSRVITTTDELYMESLSLKR
jgi:flagellar hook protein FlgE